MTFGSYPLDGEGASRVSFACGQCERTFGSSQGLALHVTRTHGRALDQDAGVEDLEDLEDVEDLGDQLAIAIDAEARDVLDALAFLTRVEGGAEGFVAQLINDVLEVNAGDANVLALIKLRQEHGTR